MKKNLILRLTVLCGFIFISTLQTEARFDFGSFMGKIHEHAQKIHKNLKNIAHNKWGKLAFNMAGDAISNGLGNDAGNFYKDATQSLMNNDDESNQDQSNQDDSSDDTSNHQRTSHSSHKQQTKHHQKHHVQPAPQEEEDDTEDNQDDNQNYQEDSSDEETDDGEDADDESDDSEDDQ